MDTIVLRLSFHTTRTLPLSDICRKLKYIQVKNTKAEFLYVNYELSNERDILQSGTAVITASLSSIPLSPAVVDSSNLYTVLRLIAQNPRPLTEEPYEVDVLLTPAKN